MKPALAASALAAAAIAGAAAAPQPQCASDDARCAAPSHDAHSQCGLYLAPSTLPRAGLGLFAGRDVPPDESVHAHLGLAGDDDNDAMHDLVLPLVDAYKTRPYRGQQRFPSYLAYVWPAYKGALSDLETQPFPTIPHELWDFDEGYDRADGLAFYWDDLDEGAWGMLGGGLRGLLEAEVALEEEEREDDDEGRIDAFVPGLASLMNAGDVLANVDRVYGYEDDEEGGNEGKGEGSGGGGIEFMAVRPIAAGMELLIDYGEEWNKRNDVKLEFMEKRKVAADATGDVRRKKGFVEGLDAKWDRLDRREMKNCPRELPTEKAKRELEAGGVSRDSDAKDPNGKRWFSEYRPNALHPNAEGEYDDDEEWDESLFEEYPEGPNDITQSLPWLEENGVCLSSGKLRVGPSTLPHAGRGVHATATIKKGEVVLPTPLLAMRHEDYVIYHSNPEEKAVKKIVDKTKVLGMELVYNYAFSHPDSPLYLVPSAPLANFFNNGGKEANVRVRWPEAGSSAAKLFEWSYSQKRGSHFSTAFDPASAFDHPNPWLKDHPIDVMERSGKLALEFVALKDISPGEELLLDYGTLWENAWTEHLQQEGKNDPSSPFRQPIGVPDGFFPDNWLGVSDRYEVAEIKGCGEGLPECSPPAPGVAVPLTWVHNGQPIGSKYAYAVGLPKGFSDRFRKRAEGFGIVELYRKLLTEQPGYKIPSNGFQVFRPGTLVNGTSSDDETVQAIQFFAHRYAESSSKFNMHFTAAWNEVTRKAVFAAMGDSGFDYALKGIGERFGYDNITCFHASFMGITHCENSIMHTDIYATHDKSWNLVFPLLTVEGSDPELDILAEGMNTVIGVNYLKDVAYAMGDWGYHQTIPMAYYDPETERKAPEKAPIRLVFGTYCSEIDESNAAILRHVYDGDDPAPFIDQFDEVPMREVHWKAGSPEVSMANPGGRGY